MVMAWRVAVLVSMYGNMICASAEKADAIESNYTNLGTGLCCDDGGRNYPNYYFAMEKTDATCRAQCSSDTSCVAYAIITSGPSSGGCFIHGPAVSTAPPNWSFHQGSALGVTTASGSAGAICYKKPQEPTPAPTTWPTPAPTKAQCEQMYDCQPGQRCKRETDAMGECEPCNGNNDCRQALSKINAVFVADDGSASYSVRSGGDKAWDNDPSTFYDARAASGGYTAADLSKPYRVQEIRYIARAFWTGRMVGGKFQGAHYLGGRWFTLATITHTPSFAGLNYQSIADAGSFRYIRYYSPDEGYCNIAEIELFGEEAPDGGDSADEFLPSSTSSSPRFSSTRPTPALRGPTPEPTLSPSTGPAPTPSPTVDPQEQELADAAFGVAMSRTALIAIALAIFV